MRRCSSSGEVRFQKGILASFLIRKPTRAYLSLPRAYLSPRQGSTRVPTPHPPYSRPYGILSVRMQTLRSETAQERHGPVRCVSQIVPMPRQALRSTAPPVSARSLARCRALSLHAVPPEVPVVPCQYDIDTRPERQQSPSQDAH